MRPERIAVVVMAGLVVICAAWVVVLSGKFSRSRRENQELRAQNDAFEKSKSTTEQAPNSASGQLGLGQTSAVDPGSETEHRELLRLRNEVSRLRQGNLNLNGTGSVARRQRLYVEERVVRRQRDNETVEMAQGERPGGMLGIGIRATGDTDLNSKQGVIVTEIQKGGPSENKLEVGDIISSVDGGPTRDVGRFVFAVRRKKPDLPVILGIYRGNERMDVQVTPVELTEQRPSP